MSAAKKIDSEIKKEVIELPRELSAKYLHQFFEKIKDSDSIYHLIFNFEKTQSIETLSYPNVHKIKNHILKSKGTFQSININSHLFNQLQSDGVSGLFNFQNVPDSKSVSYKKMDADFLNHFIEATVTTFHIQTSLKVTSKTPVLKKEANPTVEIVGVVSLVSPHLEGSISICFPRATFLAVCNRLFGEASTEINHENEDAAGEILNMIFGAAKGQLNNKYNCQIQRAIPTIIHGLSLKLKQTKGPTILLPFESEVGLFHLEIEVAER